MRQTFGMCLCYYWAFSHLPPYYIIIRQTIEIKHQASCWYLGRQGFHWYHGVLGTLGAWKNGLINCPRFPASYFPSFPRSGFGRPFWSLRWWVQCCLKPSLFHLKWRCSCSTASTKVLLIQQVAAVHCTLSMLVILLIGFFKDTKGSCSTLAY